MRNQEDILEFCRDNDVKFLRISFCDVRGIMKNISVRPGELERTHEMGFAFDGAGVEGFSCAKGPLFLSPDPSTLAILPWRPQTGRVARVFCDLIDSGSPFPVDGRNVLTRRTRELAREGFTLGVTVSAPFYLFMAGDDGQATDIPHDNAGYLDVAPKDKGENARREISLALEEMGITPMYSYHAWGPGQNVVCYEESDPLRAAENFVSFKYLVKTIASRNGLYASFMPSPLPGFPPNSVEISAGLRRLIVSADQDEDDMASQNALFAEGIRARLNQLSAFLCACADSSYGIEARLGHDGRVSVKNADPAMNPYYTLALLTAAGIEGLKGAARPAPHPPVTSLDEALEHARDPFCALALGREALDAYIQAKTEEARFPIASLHSKYFPEL